MYLEILIFLLNILGFKSTHIDDDDKRSLVFVFDTTGSMDQDLQQVIDGAQSILETVLRSDTNFDNFVFVPFNDPVVGPVMSTTSYEELKHTLTSIKVQGGDDCPEMSLGGIELALKHSYKNSFIYVFSDVSSKDFNILDGVLDLVQKQGSRIVFVLSNHGDCNDRNKSSYQVYHKIAAASNGQVFHLRKENVHNILDYVKTQLEGSTVNLGSITKPAGENYNHSVPVDATLNSVTVSVSGRNPRVNILNPNGTEVNGPPKLVKTVDLDEIKVLTLVEPEPGNWSVNLMSENRNTLAITGISDYNFKAGFSMNKPLNMIDTYHRPMQGEITYLMIEPTNTSTPIELQTVDLIEIESRKKNVLKLNKINHTYLTEKFLPPREFFYIAVNGRDSAGNYVRRLGSTAIQPQTPNLPFVLTPREYNVIWKQSLILNCTVESPIPVHIKWIKNNNILLEQYNKSSSTFQYVKGVTSLDDGGLYSCVVENSVGITTSYTNVTVLSLPVVSIMSNKDVDNIQRDDELTITCQVSSPKPIEEVLFYTVIGNQTKRVEYISNKYPPHTYSFEHYIEHVKTNATYICMITNKDGRTSDTITIKIPEKLEVYFLNRPDHLILNQSFDIECHARNALKAVIVDSSSSHIKAEKERSSPGDIYLNYFIEHVELQGSDVWFCYAYNADKHLSAGDRLDLVVYMIPEATLRVDNESELVVKEYGSHIEVVCEMEASPIPIFNLIYPNGQIYKKTTKTPINELNKNKYEYSISIELNEINEGIYKCYGSNKAGVGSIASVEVLAKMQQTPQVLPEDKIVDLYSKTYLECRINSYPNSTIIWHHNSMVVPANMTSDNGTILNILSMDEADYGVYVCEARNRFERNYFNGSLNITGWASPKVYLNETERFVNVDPKSNITLFCDIKGTPYPEITWSYVSPDCNEEENRISCANIKNTNISCTGTNMFGSTTQYFYITVKSEPGINDIIVTADGDQFYAEEVLEMELNKSIQVNCSTYGDPEPEVVWLKNGNTVSINTILILRNITEDDSGIYLCVASNQFGWKEKGFQLILLSAPKITNIFNEIQNNTVTIIESQKLSLNCHPHGNPRPEVTWYKNKDTINIDKDDRMSMEDLDEIFIIDNVSLKDSGNYSCLASNYLGDDRIDFIVEVLESPRLEELRNASTHILRKVGDKVILKCPLNGFPRPQVKWIKHPYIDMYTANIKGTRFNDYNSTLILSNVSLEYSGEYTCISTNMIGVIELTYIVEVASVPSIKHSNITKHVTADIRRSVVFMCEASGYPTPKITWFKNGSELHSNGSDIQILLNGRILLLVDTYIKHGGVYVCSAHNYAGSNEKVYELTVRVEGIWSKWSNWSLCNVTCDSGIQYRSRKCQFPSYDSSASSIDMTFVVLDKVKCKGDDVMTRECHMPPCETEWSEWSSWFPCSSSCDDGVEMRTRQCLINTRPCMGETIQIRKCRHLPPCSNNIPNVYDDLETFEPQEIDRAEPTVEGNQSVDTITVEDDVLILNSTSSNRCGIGYQVNEFGLCNDIDECSEESNKCHSTQYCVNTQGSYSCSCPAGYKSLGDGQRCLDLDECTIMMDICEHICINIPGGYVCACPEHMTLNDDLKTCSHSVDIDTVNLERTKDYNDEVEYIL